MLGDGRTAHGKSQGQDADRLRPAAQPLEYPAARGITEALQCFSVSHYLR